MKRILVVIIFFSSLQWCYGQNIPAKPNPPKLVNDYATVLSREQREILEQRLVALDDSTGNQIAIVTVKTLDGYPIEDFTLKILREWGIGGKKNNNGVVIFAAIDDHKLRIEIGYGLEGAIPDITASAIISNDLAPNFRQGDYYRGFDEAITSLSRAAAGEYHEPREKNDGGGGESIFVFLIIMVIVIIIISRSGGRGGGGFASRRGYRSLPGTFWFPGGGGWSGGGGGGGWSGGGGGGFGGFGGGGGGGGGASGGW